METEKKIISKKKYQYLRQFLGRNLSPEEIESMEEYEETNSPGADAEKNEKYFESLKSEKKEIKPSTNEMAGLFYQKFEQEEKTKFAFTPEGKHVGNYEEAVKLLYTMIYFFEGKDNFLKSPLLAFTQNSTPSLDKGLLIIGNYGCGKTSTLKSLHKALSTTDYKFCYHYADQVVADYEACANATDKDAFWKKHTDRERIYDDVLSEKVGNNYGKIEVMQTVIERRYAKRLKTSMIINYDPNFPNDTHKALEQLMERYGARVYDRIFSMFNIIALKGGSNRG
jgi:DNA replication protein DnaC